MKKIPSIVPIIIATQELTTLKKIADTLKPYLNEKNLLLSAATSRTILHTRMLRL